MAQKGKEVAIVGDNGFLLPEVIATYTFMNLEGLQIVKENIGDQPLTPADFERIKIPAGGGQTWEVSNIEGGVDPLKTIDGIILMRKRQRVYWKESLDTSGGGTPPDCFSRDAINGTGSPGGNCATCPFAQWGTAKDSKGNPAAGKACKEVDVQLIIRPGNILPNVIQVPPTSLGVMKKFMLGLANAQIRYQHAVVSIGLEVAQNKAGIKYSKIKPAKIAVLPPEARAQIDEYISKFKEAFEKVEVAPEDVGPDAE